MIYLIGNEELRTVKVGYSETTEGVFQRLRDMQSGNCCKLEVLSIIEGDKELKETILEDMRASKKRGEWFHVTSDSAYCIKNYFPSLQRDILDSYHGNKFVCGKKYTEAFMRRASHSPDRTMDQIVSELDIEGYRRDR
jgi:hypothetical protein